MPTKKSMTPAKKKTTAASAPRARAIARAIASGPPSESDIASRAYSLFLQRGGEHGRDQEDWLRAERELNSVD